MSTRTSTAPNAQQIVFVTGMSGSGKGTALRALEDSGFFCIDNLPAPAVPKLIELLAHAPEVQKLALVVDAREPRFLPEAPKAVAEAKAQGHDVELLFLDASDDVLIRRFSETRRRHPLSPEGTVLEGIAAERALLADFRAMANDVIDTSRTTVHELKALLQDRFASEQGELVVSVVSFAYRHGLPTQADIVLDLRFLPNPFFVPDLRELPGTTPAVSRWIMEHQVARDFLERVQELLAFLLPRYRDEGKAYFTVALGCTGGRHRSVALSEALGNALATMGFRARVRHRDVDRE